MIVYVARDIPPFVMYCVDGESGSSLLTESTDSMIYIRIYTQGDRAGRDGGRGGGREVKFIE